MFLKFFASLSMMGASGAESTQLPLWFWVLLVLVLIVLPILVVWFGPRLGKKEQVGETELEVAKPAREELIEEAVVAKPEDLKIIEGIGPKIAMVLQQAGIDTFSQLAETPVEGIQAILDEHPRLRLADPRSWPEQARLAAEGNWAALEKLQDELQGGRLD